MHLRLLSTLVSPELVRPHLLSTRPLLASDLNGARHIPAVLYLLTLVRPHGHGGMERAVMGGEATGVALVQVGHFQFELEQDINSG